MSEQTTTLLEVKNLSVSFDGFKALTNVDFRLKEKEIKVLIGPNGAGKSTLCDCVIGKVRPSEGNVFYKGKDISRVTEYKINQLGICRKFQAPGILERLSVFENLAIASRVNRSWHKNLKLGISKAERERIEEVIALIGLEEKRHMEAAYLAHGEKQWLEIGMVVSQNPDLLLLDEPTAGMTAQETAKTAELIRKLVADHTVLVIDHDMTFVELLAAPVSVLHQGQMLKEGSIDEVRNDPEVIKVYLGRSQEQEGQEQEGLDA